MSPILEAVAVEFGLDDAYESVQENGFVGAIEKGINDVQNKVSETVSGIGQKVKDVGGYIKEDLNNLKEGITDFFASDEEKAAKAAEEEAKRVAEEAEQKAIEEAMELYKAELEKSYILHTALVTCDKAYTNEAIWPSYIVLPTSHGESIHGLPQLTVADFIADVNVLNFGICRSPHNPAVQAAAREILDKLQQEEKSWTDRLLGIFVNEDNKNVSTKEKECLAEMCAAPCKPHFFEEWADGKTDVLIDGKPALLGRCKLCCEYGGTIEIQTSGQMEE